MSPASPIVLEICANSLPSALEAQEGGADRVELCDNLLEGGTTPSYATLLKARELLHIQLYPIIRPRGGDFLYTDLEFEVMRSDIRMCKQIGCNGVVVGMLLQDGSLDIERLRILMEEAWPMGVTFHRAFDMCSHPEEVLESLIDLGVERILSSGQRRNALEGAPQLARWHQQAAGRIGIMAGSGVRVHNIATIRHQTGIEEFHSTAQKTLSSRMSYRNAEAQMSEGGKEYDIQQTDQDTVRHLRAAAEAPLD